MLARAERLLQADEHDVERARLELDALARLDLQSPFHRPHLRDAVLHGHLMDFELGRDVRRTADEAIGCRSVVGDFHVAGRNARSLRGRARPWIGTVERAGLKVAGARRTESQGECRGKDESNGAHFYPPDDVNEQPRALRPTSTQRADRRRVRRTSEARAIPAADAAAAMAALRSGPSQAPTVRKNGSARTPRSPEAEAVNCCMPRDKPRSRFDVVPAQAGARPRNRPCT